MPCYEVRLTSVEFKAKHKDLLLKALKSLGYRTTETTNKVYVKNFNMTFDLKNEKVIMEDTYQYRLNDIKVQYSKECIQEAAKKKKWLLKKLANNKFQAKRY